MLDQIINYCKNEMIPQEGKIAFLIPKLVILSLIGVIALWGTTLGDEKPIEYWILFIFIVVISSLLLILTYIGKKNN